ncbi:MAG TPA: sulfatase-like hydrolase/transferase, partial [Thermoanaerobaculia bacterium]|nr:sulfatase-like hydrolase/transferase [Thermoanaerobaculia bacterium]
MASFRALRLQQLLALSVAAALASCGGEPAKVQVAQRLTDDFSPRLVSGAARTTPQPPLAEWRFSVPAAGQAGWEPFSGVQGLEVSGGLLKGEATNKVPLIRLPGIRLETNDLIREVQVRMRTNKEGAIAAYLVGREMKEEELAFLAGAEGVWPGEATVPAGDRMATFSIPMLIPLTGADIGQIMLRTPNVPGARFEIESVRIVFNGELKATMPSGVGWHELSQSYREAVLARAPESIRWEVDLPDQPRLSLSLGTLDPRPVVFRVDLQPQEGEAVTLFERTVTRPLRWEDASFDLDRWRGRRVTLKLSLTAEPGATGLWGSPVVRRRGMVGEREGGQRAAGGPRPQGVIFIVADTLRPDRLGIYGHGRPTAPVLTRMAREGALFRDAQSQGTWTKVSGPSMMTSLPPLSTGVRFFMDRLPASATTLAEVYRARGYATAGYSSVPFMGTFNSLHQGFERLHEVPENHLKSKTARGVVDAFLPWLDEHADEPFFVFLHMFDPHDPYEPDAPYNQLWA